MRRHSLKLISDFCRGFSKADSAPMSAGGFQIPYDVGVDCKRLFLSGEFFKGLCVVLMSANYGGHFF
jgi:hypothetical protein